MCDEVFMDIVTKSNLREKFIEACERELDNHGTGREMRFIGGDVTPVIANCVTVDNRCVCCGEIIPEGRQVCPMCEKKGYEDD